MVVQQKEWRMRLIQAAMSVSMLAMLEEGTTEPARSSVVPSSGVARPARPHSTWPRTYPKRLRHPFPKKAPKGFNTPLRGKMCNAFWRRSSRAQRSLPEAPLCPHRALPIQLANNRHGPEHTPKGFNTRFQNSPKRLQHPIEGQDVQCILATRSWVAVGRGRFRVVFGLFLGCCGIAT